MNDNSVETYHDYVNFDPVALRNSIDGIPWDVFHGMDDVNQLTEYFNNSILAVHDSCIPVRTVRRRTHYNTWFNDDIRKSILERDMAYKDWRIASVECKDDKKRTYTQLRNRTNALIRRVKSQHVDRSIATAGSTKNLWRMVKTFGVGKSEDRTDCSFEPDLVNRKFASNFTTDDAAGFMQHEPQPVGGFCFRRIEPYEVINAFCEVKSNAVGCDRIPTRFLKLILPLVSDHIVHLYNKIIESSTFPDAWKRAKIIPLKKKKHINSLENLRPISLLPVLSKVLEKLLKAQISSYLTNGNLLSDDQAGFRRGHSVKTALLRVYDDIAVLVDRRNKVVLLLIDFSKAFDTISHHRLLRKLRTRFSFTSSAVVLIESYLSGRSQFVHCNDVSSTALAVTSGVPQGSVLGPLLFSIYLDDLPGVLRYCRVQMFADDVQLYCSHPDARIAVARLNEDLQRVVEWATRNSLRINHAKTKAIMFGINQHINPTTPLLTVDGNQIEFIDHANNLGIIFQSNLCWDRAVSAQCGKVYAGLRTLRATTSDLPQHIKLQLFKSLILPHFIFGDVIHLGMSMAMMSKLEVALNDCCRYVYNLSRYTSVRNLQKNLLGCPFRRFYEMRACLQLWRIFRRNEPSNLAQKLRLLQGRRSLNFMVPTHRTTLYGESFFVRSVVYWNAQPTELKRIQSETLYKKAALEYFNRN